jgi:hypothetical protein
MHEKLNITSHYIVSLNNRKQYLKREMGIIYYAFVIKDVNKYKKTSINDLH